jgi:hypothetical protein
MMLFGRIFRLLRRPDGARDAYKRAIEKGGAFTLDIRK